MKKSIITVMCLATVLSAIEPDNYLSIKDYVEPVQTQAQVPQNDSEQPMVSSEAIAPTVDDVEEGMVLAEEDKKVEQPVKPQNENSVSNTKKIVKEKSDKKLNESTIKEKVSSILGDLKEKLDKSKEK